MGARSYANSKISLAIPYSLFFSYTCEIIESKFALETRSHSIVSAIFLAVP